MPRHLTLKHLSHLFRSVSPFTFGLTFCLNRFLSHRCNRSCCEVSICGNSCCKQLLFFSPLFLKFLPPHLNANWHAQGQIQKADHSSFDFPQFAALISTVPNWDNWAHQLMDSHMLHPPMVNSGVTEGRSWKVRYRIGAWQNLSKKLQRNGVRRRSSVQKQKCPAVFSFF